MQHWFNKRTESQKLALSGLTMIEQAKTGAEIFDCKWYSNTRPSGKKAFHVTSWSEDNLLHGFNSIFFKKNCQKDFIFLSSLLRGQQKAH